MTNKLQKPAAGRRKMFFHQQVDDFIEDGAQLFDGMDFGGIQADEPGNASEVESHLPVGEIRLKLVEARFVHPVVFDQNQEFDSVIVDPRFDVDQNAEPFPFDARDDFGELPFILQMQFVGFGAQGFELIERRHGKRFTAFGFTDN